MNDYALIGYLLGVLASVCCHPSPKPRVSVLWFHLHSAVKMIHRTFTKIFMLRLSHLSSSSLPRSQLLSHVSNLHFPPAPTKWHHLRAWSLRKRMLPEKPGGLFPQLIIEITNQEPVYLQRDLVGRQRRGKGQAPPERKPGGGMSLERSLQRER